jgi:hypothetical protein
MYENDTLRRGALALAMILGLGLSGAAQAAAIFLSADIDGAQAGTTSGSTASADVQYDTNTMELDWSISEVTPFFDTPVSFAHFHGPALPGDTAGVQVWICDNTGDGPTGTPLCGIEGELFSVGSAGISADQADDLLSGLWYINIHTEEYPPGEIRGQVLQAQVPEPGTLTLLLFGMAGTRFWHRSRRR